MAAAWHGGIATTRARALPSTAPRTPVRAAAAAVAEGTRGERAAMSSSAAKVAVVGCGISGALCASILAGRGISVTVFESGRGPGGRMSQRRELAEDEELLFDHGAPCFSTSNEEVTNIVKSWEEMGLISEWKEKFGCFDMKSSNFVDFEKDGSSKKYVGVPGMNSICKALCREPGVETKFESAVGKLNWLEGRNMWHLSGMSSENLGHFDSVVVSDKNVFSPRYAGLTGRPPPLAHKGSPSSPSLLLLLLLSMAVGLLGAASAWYGGRGPLVGGYQKIKDVNDPHIKEIGQYAVAEHNWMSEQSLVFVRVVGRWEQVVAGMNYDLVIKARDGRRAPALYEAVVYEQAGENYWNLTPFNPKP